MGLLIIRLLIIINTQDRDSTNHHIAQSFLKYYDLIQTSSIDEMAERINVSKSKLSKFAREIGFDSYIHLKDEAEFIENKYANDYNYLSHLDSYFDADNLSEYFKMVQKDIEHLYEGLDMQAIERLVDDLIKFEEIGIFGLLFSESAALDFQYKLAYNHKFVTTYQDDLKQEEYIRQADENTLLIILSNSGDFLRRQQVTPGRPAKRYFTDSKAKIIAITSDTDILNLEYVDDAIIYPRSFGFQTHNILYQILFDIITARYRAKIESID